MTKANQERQDRLAQALRANLHRRKAQSRARKAGEADGTTPSTTDDRMKVSSVQTPTSSAPTPEAGDQDG